MSLRDELGVATNKVALLRFWVDSHPERDEWLEIMRRGDLYSLSPIIELLKKRGFVTDRNALHRYRSQLEGYVPAR
jgi:hypothetical protein